MANEQNLTHKLTVSEQRKGGRKSGKVRREQKTFRELAKTILALKPDSDKLKQRAKALGIDDPNNKEMAVIGLMLSAIGGNHNAFDRLLTLAGEDVPVNDSQENEHNGLIEAIRKRNEDK